MVTVKKRVIGGGTYYYLEHSVRINGKVEKKETYLGKAVPKRIEEIKKDFLASIYGEKWFRTFDNIRRNFAKERSLMPKSAREEELKKFSIRFTYDTQRIEGSALTLRDSKPSRNGNNSSRQTRSRRKRSRGPPETFLRDTGIPQGPITSSDPSLA